MGSQYKLHYLWCTTLAVGDTYNAAFSEPKLTVIRGDICQEAPGGGHISWLYDPGQVPPEDDRTLAGFVYSVFIPKLVAEGREEYAHRTWRRFAKNIFPFVRESLLSAITDVTLREYAEWEWTVKKLAGRSTYGHLCLIRQALRLAKGKEYISELPDLPVLNEIGEATPNRAVLSPDDLPASSPNSGETKGFGPHG